MENNIKTRNLIQEANAALVSTQAAFVGTSNNVIFPAGVPAKVARASMANTNLLSNSGDLFVGTGNTLTEQIDGTEYTWAEVSKINRSDLFVDGFNSTSTNSGLTANVGAMIDKCLHVSKTTTDESTVIIMGDEADAQGQNSIIIGNSAFMSASNGIAMGRNSSTSGDGGIAIGYQSKAQSSGAVAIGCGAQCASEEAYRYPVNSIAIGNGAKATVASAIQLGGGTNSSGGTFQVKNVTLLNANGKIPSSLYTDMIIQPGNGSNGIAIGNGASLGNEVYSGVQLGVGSITNQDTYLKVYEYTLLDNNGKIPEERLPKKLYKHILGFSSSTSSYTSISYICEWYSSQSGLPTGEWDVIGGAVVTTSTASTLYWVDFNFLNEGLTVRYLNGIIIETFTYNEIKRGLTTQEI